MKLFKTASVNPEDITNVLYDNEITEGSTAWNFGTSVKFDDTVHKLWLK